MCVSGFLNFGLWSIEEIMKDIVLFKLATHGNIKNLCTRTDSMHVHCILFLPILVFLDIGTSRF